MRATRKITQHRAHDPWCISSLLGADICERLRDVSVMEVGLDPGGLVWSRHYDGTMYVIGRTSREWGLDVVEAVAEMLGVCPSDASPIVEGFVPQIRGYFEGMMPPFLYDPVFVIRSDDVMVHTFDDYLHHGGIRASHRRYLDAHVNLSGSHAGGCHASA